MDTPETDLVLHTPRLARLELSHAEAEQLGPQFARILAAFRALESLDPGDAEGMARAVDDAGRLREDEPRPSLAPDSLLGNAPRREGDFYAVPKTVGGDG